MHRNFRLLTSLSQALLRTAAPQAHRPTAAAGWLWHVDSLQQQGQGDASFSLNSSFRWQSTMADIAQDLETVNEKFVEARDEIEYAQEDAETTYFNESHETAKKAVQECLDLFNKCRGQLEESEQGKLQRSMGMKMEQLKEELAQLDTLHE